MSVKNIDIMSIPDEKFQFRQKDANIHDEKIATKKVGYFKDAFRRFCKNKSSVVAAIIIILLVLYAIFVPIIFSNNYTKNPRDTTYLEYIKLPPKSHAFQWLGWDGTQQVEVNTNQYNVYSAIGAETGLNPVKDYYTETVQGKELYYIKLDKYYALGMIYMTLTTEQYEDLQQWQTENDIQVIYPMVDSSVFDGGKKTHNTKANIYYEILNNGAPDLNDEGEIVARYATEGNDGGYNSIRIDGDDGSYKYAAMAGSSSAPGWKVRICKYTYFQYRYGFEPCFLFGTNNLGQDIFTRLASAARFSFLLAIFVSAINLTVGAIYGAIEGYYGGIVDLTMERISDVLNGIPFMVVAALFQLHLAKEVGPIGSLIFAFFITGWIGMAGTVRMQFYRYKNQEYVLAARTLGASDFRIMFKHIFPNALGTIITGCVLVIPGVIFSESSLTYLGIVNLESSTMTSVGTMLANARDYVSTEPYIVFFPAMFIALLEISFNLFGNGLRDAFNPSLRGAED